MAGGTRAGARRRVGKAHPPQGRLRPWGQLRRSRSAAAPPPRVPPAKGQRKKAAKGRFQLVEKPLGARGPQPPEAIIGFGDTR